MERSWSYLWVILYSTHGNGRGVPIYSFCGMEVDGKSMGSGALGVLGIYDRAFWAPSFYIIDNRSRIIRSNSISFPFSNHNHKCSSTDGTVLSPTRYQSCKIWIFIECDLLGEALLTNSLLTAGPCTFFYPHNRFSLSLRRANSTVLFHSLTGSHLVSPFSFCMTPGSPSLLSTSCSFYPFPPTLFLLSVLF